MFWGQALIEFSRTNKARSWSNFRAWHLKTDSKSAFATSLVGSPSRLLTTSFGISAFDMSRGTHSLTLPMSSRLHHFPNRLSPEGLFVGYGLRYVNVLACRDERGFRWPPASCKSLYFLNVVVLSRRCHRRKGSVENQDTVGQGALCPFCVLRS